MKALPLLALFPLSLIAQNPIPAGSYKASSLGNALELRIGNNNTYELVGASGNYTLKRRLFWLRRNRAIALSCKLPLK